MVGEIIECDVDGEVAKARVSAVRPTSVGADIGQPLDFVDVDEI
jgi:hypothetical protein